MNENPEPHTVRILIRLRIVSAWRQGCGSGSQSWPLHGQGGAGSGDWSVGHVNGGYYIERAFYPVNLGMAVAHGRFQASVPQRHLDISNVSASV